MGVGFLKYRPLHEHFSSSSFFFCGSHRRRRIIIIGLMAPSGPGGRRSKTRNDFVRRTKIDGAAPFSVDNWRHLWPFLLPSTCHWLFIVQRTDSAIFWPVEIVLYAQSTSNDVIYSNDGPLLMTKYRIALFKLINRCVIQFD